MNIAIRTQNLSRSFKKFNAVENLNLSIQKGEIYGFLGANGAGKTTTIKMLVGLLEPSTGQAWIAGHNAWTDPLAAKAALGYVADRAILYERLTGREFLNFLAQLRGIPLKRAKERVEHVLDYLELTEHADRLCGAYSFGMKRKLALAGALLHQPPVLILDEPLNGLDPRSAHRLKGLMVRLFFYPPMIWQLPKLYVTASVLYTGDNCSPRAAPANWNRWLQHQTWKLSSSA